jgi:CheY-like chemotaxis protein
MTAPRILIVEDEALVALGIEDLLLDLGCEIAGSVAAVPEALDWLDAGGSFDGALLDVRLGDQLVFPVAERLARMGAPFAFATGYGEISDERFLATPLLTKPLMPERLRAAMRDLGLLQAGT